jgi:hypothetical protein
MTQRKATQSATSYDPEARILSKMMQKCEDLQCIQYYINQENEPIKMTCKALTSGQMKFLTQGRGAYLDLYLKYQSTCIENCSSLFNHKGCSPSNIPCVEVIKNNEWQR